VARFEEEQAKWPEEAWSLVLEFNGHPYDSLCDANDIDIAEDHSSLDIQLWTTQACIVSSQQ